MTVSSPRAPTWAGFDWPVTRQGGIVLDDAQTAYAALLRSSAAETINKFSTYVEKLVGDPATLQLDIWPAANLPETGSGGTAIFDPISDGTMSLGAAGAGTPNNTVGQRYQNIDDGAVLNSADYIRIDATSPTASYVTVQPNSGGTPFGGGTHRISTVRLKVVMAGNNQQWVLAPMLRVSGSPDKTITFQPITRVIQGDIEYTFTATALDDGTPITEAFITALQSQTGLYGIFFQVTPSAGGPLSCYLRRLRLEVDWSNEYRVVAASTALVSAAGWVTFGAFTNWAKANATDYIAVIRKVAGGTVVIPTLDSGAAHPNGHRSYNPVVSDTDVVTDLGAQLTELPPFIPQTTAPGISVDSQDYANLRLELIYAGRTVVQEVTAPDASTRQLLQVIAGGDTPEGPGAPLIGRIKNTGTGVQVGGDATFGLELIADDLMGLHALRQTMAAGAALANGTQYDIELSSVATSDDPWVVAVLDSLSPPAGSDAQGYGGLTDRGEIATVEYDDLDLPGVLMATAPAAPVIAAAAAGVLSGISYIDVSWNQTALGANFAGYTIEKQINGGPWYPVGFVLVEATTAWRDWEPPQGSATSYRVRVAHINGTFSAPSGVVNATATGLYYTLTSNRLPTLNTIVRLERPSSLIFPREQEVAARYNRRFQTITQSPQDRGLALDTNQHVIVSGSSRGLDMFDSYRALMDAAVPYLCLRDPWGGIKYVGLIGQGGDQTVPTYGKGKLTLVELTQIPDQVIV